MTHKCEDCGRKAKPCFEESCYSEAGQTGRDYSLVYKCGYHRKGYGFLPIKPKSVKQFEQYVSYSIHQIMDHIPE